MRLEEGVRTEPEDVHDADEQPQSRDVDVPSGDEQVCGEGRPEDGEEHQLPGHGSDEKDAVLEYPQADGHERREGDPAEHELFRAHGTPATRRYADPRRFV